ncbi:uncharacterized protein LOC129596628 isoform X2 [Paramacrobiotus metropolitanus]|uniref:uncharacterized protein LOC129596628 isoform X2 n=1 Tax=Paramacrobiotus metropolitanus TaxID=2943436 RepID=UPI00244609A8|nr:uncharacterized protein LOC129596628 isoform X2 [Paramacrobiotus metropolitanus]
MRRRTLRYYLLKVPTWGYQEIITEALVVLWFACQISLKFGMRSFSGWRANRVDPNAPLALDEILEFFGYRMNACLWDDVMSAWESASAMPASSGAVHSSRPAVGYMGTVAMVWASAVLAVAVCCSLYINRNWKYSPWHWQYHFRHCRRLAAIFGYSGYDIPSCIATVLRCVPLLVGLGCVATVWLVVCALPVVVLAATIVVATAKILGTIAVFPSCVIIICLLALNCLGRLCGLWMDRPYLAAVYQKIQRMLLKRKISKYYLLEVDTGNEVATQPKRLYALCVECAAFMLGCMVVMIHTYHMTTEFPIAAFLLSRVLPDRILWTMDNGTEHCISQATRITHAGAMTSYWAAKPDNILIGEGFEAWWFPQTLGAALMFVSALLLIASGFQTARFGAGRYGLKFLTYLVECFGQDDTGEPNAERASRTSPTIKEGAGEIQKRNSTYIFADCQCEPAVRDILDAADQARNGGKEYSCQCYQLGNLVLDSLWLMCWVSSWWFLPFPLAEFLLSERLQFPTLLIVVLGYFLWIITMSESRQTAESPDVPAKKDPLIGNDIQGDEKAGDKKAKGVTCICSTCGFTWTPCGDVRNEEKKTVSTGTSTSAVDMSYPAQNTVNDAKNPALQ